MQRIPVLCLKPVHKSGSEWQNDYVDLPDYYQTFFRNYDAAIGRFVGVDVQAEAAESWTSYQYGYNNPGMLNDPMGDLVEVSGRYADFWNKLINSAGSDNVEFHNYDGIYGGTNGDIFDTSGSDGGGHDIYVDSSGQIQKISSNGYSGNRYYGWETGTDAKGTYHTVTGQLSNEEVRARFNAQASREQAMVRFRGEMALQPDLAKPVYDIAEFVAVGEFMEAGMLAYRAYQAGRALTTGLRAFRYMSAGELEAVKATNLLRGGRAGETYFTKDVYKSALKAAERLGLENAPSFRVEFEILNNPSLLNNGTKVLPLNGLIGGGSEFMTTDKVIINLINWQPLR